MKLHVLAPLRSLWILMLAVLGLVIASWVAWPRALQAQRVDTPRAPALPIADVAEKANPKLPADFQPYVETIPGFKNIKFKMIPVPGGKFTMGSPKTEKGRLEDEGPQVELTMSPYWIMETEVPWELYDIFSFKYDIKQAQEAKKKGTPLKRTPADLKADGVTRPTPPYVDMTFGYGQKGNPAICMTQHAATQFCKWLSVKTGKTYELPSEAQFEFAARAGTKTQWSFGDDPKKLGTYAWYFENSNEKPQPIGKKKPNPLGLYDMHGNVAEWCKDTYTKNYFKYLQEKKMFKDPVVIEKGKKWHTARGGSWDDDPELTRSAIRLESSEDWSVQDPQEPKSIWYHTDAHWVGFRVIRPYQPKKAGK